MKYRSGLEDRVGAQIMAREGSVAYETTKVAFTIPERQARYTPDWHLKNGILVETKGILDLETRQRHLLIKQQHPELDIRFVFSNSKARIYKGSKTTYAVWCTKHGFKYADKMIPVSWFSE